MKQEINPAVAVAAIVGLVVVIGIVMFIRSNGLGGGSGNSAPQTKAMEQMKQSSTGPGGTGVAPGGMQVPSGMQPGGMQPGGMQPSGMQPSSMGR